MYAKRLLAVLLVVCLAAVALVACASPAATKAPEASAAPATAEASAAAPATTTAPAASAATTAAADESLAKIEAQGYFTVGLDDAFPPMGFRDDTTNDIIGFDIDLAKAVAKKMGLEVKFQPCASWSTVVQEMDRGDFDMIWNGFSITEERAEKVDFSKPYINNDMLVVVMQDSEIQTLADLAGKKASIQAGSSAEGALEENTELKGSLSEVVSFDDNSKAIMDLERGSVDCLIVDSVLFSYYNRENLGKYRALNEQLDSEQMGIGFRKGDTSLREAVQDALDAVMASDEGLAICTEWFGEDVRVK